MAEFRTRFSERIQALSASQDLLVHSAWKGVGLDDLVRSQLAHFGDLLSIRISIRGPSVLLNAAAAQSIGMALHELATNASKYGSLSNEAGRVTITWDVRPGGVAGALDFIMAWDEHGGPPVREPARKGFGSRVTSDVIRRSFNARVEADYYSDGFRWGLRCAATQVLEGPAAEFPSAPVVAPQAGDNANRILVVEDEALAAMELEMVLADAGFDVLGPAASVAEAFALLDAGTCVAAVLDVNLGSETSEPIAARLQSDGVPFITVSGYSRSQLPRIYQDGPLLAKPLRAALLIAEIKRCVVKIAV